MERSGTYGQGVRDGSCCPRQSRYPSGWGGWSGMHPGRNQGLGYRPTSPLFSSEVVELRPCQLQKCGPVWTR